MRAHYHSQVKTSLANCSDTKLVELWTLWTPEHLSKNCLVEYLGLCVSAHVDASKRFTTSVLGGLLDLLGCSGSVATAGSPPSHGQIYSQYRLPVSLLLSYTDEPGRSQTDAPGDWSVTGNGGGERREGERGREREGCEEERENQSDEISDS